MRWLAGNNHQWGFCVNRAAIANKSKGDLFIAFMPIPVENQLEVIMPNVLLVIEKNWNMLAGEKKT